MDTAQLHDLHALALVGLDNWSLHALAAAQLTSAAVIDQMTDADVLAISGIGPVRLRAVREAAALVLLEASMSER